MSKQFVLFLLAGGLAAAANFGSRFLFSIYFSYPVAIVCAYLVGMSLAFVLMRIFVFEAQQGQVNVQILKFIGVNILAVIQTLLISLVLARWFLPAVGVVDHAESISHLVGVLVPVVTSYFGHKLATFR